MSDLPFTWEPFVGGDDKLPCRVGSESDTFEIDLVYPDYDRPQYVRIGLNAVRAVDDLRVHYDGHRGGWVVEQAADDYVTSQRWVEMAFLSDGHSRGGVVDEPTEEGP